LLKKKDVNGKFAWWILTLQEYSIDIQHSRGTANVVADALSRAPVDTEVRSEPTESVVATIQSGGYGTKEIGLLQHADDDIRQIVLVLQGFTKDSSTQWNFKFTLFKGVLYKKNPGSGRSLLLVVPSIMRRDIVEECHDSADGGHRGVEKTLARIR
jgi:hypothetical protein